MNPADTSPIAAIATPSGEGALSIIRMSGEGVLQLADRLFRGRSQLSDCAGYTVHLGAIVDRDGQVVDEVLATVFRRPHSYTGEDAVEFSCHGGTAVARAALDEALRAGARPAEPGEFTRRAFLNGRIDLSQAEAVADLIAARSDRARRISLQQLAGKLGSAVRELRDSLTDLCALLELDLDFAEEGLDLMPSAETQTRIGAVLARVRRMAASFESGRILREGITVVLAGKPNVGKSSLFNALLRENRAIVTPKAGTTRDTIEESVEIDGIAYRLIDTAGLRAAVDEAEVEGVTRTLASAKEADVILLVEDLTEAVEEEEIEALLSDLPENQHLVVALNKVDLCKTPPSSSQYRQLSNRGAVFVLTSAKTEKGVEEIRRELSRIALGSHPGLEENAPVVNRRHKEALERAARSLERGLEAAKEGTTSEFIALDVREALVALSEITGEVTSEEVLNRIFSSFCIGK
jgi:tRNA modification GTPase